MAAINITVRRFTSPGTTVTTTTLSDIRDGETAGGGGGRIIQPRSVWRKGGGAGNPGTLHEYIIRNSASDISGYLLAEESNIVRGTSDQVVAAPNTGPFPQENSFEEWSTAAGVMNGISSNGSTTAFKVEAKKAASPEDVWLKIRAYHRTTGGTETLLDEDIVGPLDTTLTQYSVNLTISQSWGTNERLVIKYRIVNNGIPF